jgi:hypothetical protein
MESFRGATTSSRQGQVVAAALSGRVIVPPYPACQRPLSTNRRTTQESFGTLKNPLFLRLFGEGRSLVSMLDIDRGAKKRSKFFLRNRAPRWCGAVKIAEVSETGVAFARPRGPPPSPDPSFGHSAKPALTITARPSMVAVDSSRAFEGVLAGVLGGHSGIPVKFSRSYL